MAALAICSSSTTTTKVAANPVAAVDHTAYKTCKWVPLDKQATKDFTEQDQRIRGSFQNPTPTRSSEGARHSLVSTTNAPSRSCSRRFPKTFTAEFGKGFSLANLKNFRKSYLTYPDGGKSYALRSFLTWTHHRLIMRVESPSAREYYITHAEQANWSTRILERQIETQSRTDRRTRTRTPRHRTTTERRRHMTHSKSKIQNSKFSLPRYDHFTAKPGFFLAQVVGESMNKRIPNGSWCLFRKPSAGSRNGKVVIVQSRDIQDPDTGGQYTLKIHRSEKFETVDSWTHRSIRLEPDSMDFNSKTLTLGSETVNELPRPRKARQSSLGIPPP